MISEQMSVDMIKGIVRNDCTLLFFYNIIYYMEYYGEFYK